MVSGMGYRCRQICTEAYENNPLAQLKAKGFAEGWVSGLFFYIPCFVTDPFFEFVDAPVPRPSYRVFFNSLKISLSKQMA